MSKRRNNKYRKIYEDHYGIEIPAGMDIHHLDFDHENNDMDNLLLLPAEHHKAYHEAVKNIEAVNQHGFTTRIIGTGESGCAANYYAAQAVSAFVAIYAEVQKWMDYKRFLEGKIDNIHGIDLSRGGGA